MNKKMIIGLFEFFQENMKDPAPNLADEVGQGRDSFLERVQECAPSEAYIDMECDALELLGLCELRGFALGLAAAREMVSLRLLDA